MDLLAKYEVNGNAVELDAKTVREYLVNGDGKPSDQEVAMFINLCRYQGLNPFLREAYLIKYSDKAPATTVVGKDAFTRRASQLEECGGWQAGVCVYNNKGEYLEREGTIVLPNEKLVGGWCRIKRKGWDDEFKTTAALNEYDQQNAMWRSKPGTMIRKVAIVQGLREAFPDRFQGMYDQSEMPMGDSTLSEAPVERKSRGKKAKDEVIEVGAEATINTEQAKMLFEMAGSEDIVKAALSEFGYEKTKQIKLSDYNAIAIRITEIKNAEPEEADVSADFGDDLEL